MERAGKLCSRTNVKSMLTAANPTGRNMPCWIGSRARPSWAHQHECTPVEGKIFAVALAKVSRSCSCACRSASGLSSPPSHFGIVRPQQLLVDRQGQLEELFGVGMRSHHKRQRIERRVAILPAPLASLDFNLRGGETNRRTACSGNPNVKEQIDLRASPNSIRQ